MAVMTNPFHRGPRGWGTLSQQNHAAVGENGSIMVGMLACLLCLASQKPSKQEFFVLARMDLGARLLN